MSNQMIATLLSCSLDAGAVITSPDVMAKYLVDQRDLLRGDAAAVVLPKSVEQVSRILALSRQHGFAVVPQGGNTGYCGGATPDMSGHQVVISLERLNRVREVDASSFSMTVDAGVILKDVHTAAATHNLFFGVSLGSEGSCQIGGAVSTNAGGISVLRYGMTRDLVMGLEVVLPDGGLFNDLRSLRKNNTGYDLKQLFIGGEGTLGIVTGAVLKLHPAPVAHATAWIALPQQPKLAEILTVVRRETADLVSSFEYMSPASLALVAPATSLPVGLGGVLIVEVSVSTARILVDDLLTGILSTLVESDLAADAVIALSGRQRTEIWACRETIPEGEKRAGGSVKHDISVPISAISTFLDRAKQVMRNYDEALVPSYYGHVGDGNIHYNILVPTSEDRLIFGKRIESELSPHLFEIAMTLGGTFSAEHGVGRLKRDLLARYGDPIRVDLMRQLKSLLDPDRQMNPGAVVD